MIQFDSQWLEKVWGSRLRKGPYQKMDLEERAGRIRSLFIQYLEMEAWKFIGEPPIDLRIKPMNAFPWMDYTWRGENGGGTKHNMPLRNRTYPAVQKFSITLAPRFLRAKDEDLLTLMDFVLYGDDKSIKALIEAFAGPRFKTDSVGSHPRTSRTTLTEFLDRLRRSEFADGPTSDWLLTQSRGEVYDLADIQKKVEADYLRCKTGARILWARGIRFRCGGYYVPEVRSVVINPALDHPEVPFVVVEHVVHHELLHHLLSRKGGLWHHKAFREAERQYPHYEEAKAWFRENNGWMMRRAKRRERT
jgi:hypothetical protein